MTNKFREQATACTWYDLQPNNSNCKSFYGKAEVEVLTQKNVVVYNLFSYKKNVARIVLVHDYENDNTTTNAMCFGKYSKTTTRHQKEFFKQFGYSEEEIKMILKQQE